MTTSQAQQIGMLDASDGKICLPEAYTCNHFARIAYAEGYAWIDPDSWTARQILGIADEAQHEDEDIPGMAEAQPFI